MSDDVFGQQSAQTTDTDFNVWQFLFALAMQKIQTVTPVKVISCSNTGGVSPVGMVTVQPCVNQMTAQRKSIPHGQLFNLPYFRLQGGNTAVILDPEPGDLGIGLFCSRDISNVVATRGIANPASLRAFDWADGLYIGGILNGVPSRYIRFDNAGNCEIVTPAGVVNINGTTIDASGNIVVKSGSTVTYGTGIVADTHQHNPGTYVAGATPVTGKSDVPVA